MLQCICIRTIQFNVRILESEPLFGRIRVLGTSLIICAGVGHRPSSAAAAVVSAPSLLEIQLEQALQLQEERSQQEEQAKVDHTSVSLFLLVSCVLIYPGFFPPWIFLRGVPDGRFWGLGPNVLTVSRWRRSTGVLGNLSPPTF